MKLLADERAVIHEAAPDRELAPGVRGRQPIAGRQSQNLIARYWAEGIEDARPPLNLHTRYCWI
jgi:hypothetical protein